VKTEFAASKPSFARKGVHVGRKRVPRLMRRLALDGVSRRGKRRRTTSRVGGILGWSIAGMCGATSRPTRS